MFLSIENSDLAYKIPRMGEYVVLSFSPNFILKIYNKVKKFKHTRKQQFM